MALKKGRTTQPKQRTEFGILGLVVALVVLGLIGYFLNDATGYPFALFGAFWWLTAVIVTFLLGALYYALFVLPTPGNEGWAEGLRLLARNYISPPRRVPTAKPLPRAGGDTAVPPHLAALPPSFHSLRSGITRSHQVLALVKGGRFSRPAGPGFVVLYKHEAVSQVIDLRRHTRSQLVKANTRDGIPIELTLFVLFRIWQQEEPALGDDVVHPFDPEAIFQVNYAGSVAADADFRRWSEQVAPQAAALLVTEIAQYSLDQLYQVDAGGVGMMNEIRQRILRNLARNEMLAGIEVLGVGFSKIDLPTAVSEQRLRQWQARWQREILNRRASGDAEVERRIKQARARAQIEIIENITQSIIDMRRNEDIDLIEVVTLRMVEALEEAASDASVRALIPPPVLSGMVNNSRDILDWMKQPPEEQP